jgi:hypothetical protein
VVVTAAVVVTAVAAGFDDSVLWLCGCVGGQLGSSISHREEGAEEQAGLRVGERELGGNQRDELRQ